MNIIIDPDQVSALREKYTVLELDTILLEDQNKTVTAYCVVENVPFMELPQLDSKKSLHENLIINYRKKDWNFCVQALEHLAGSWGGELDSFYADIQTRITRYQETDPGDDWDGVIVKSA
jgi:hypothetical protein